MRSLIDTCVFISILRAEPGGGWFVRLLKRLRPETVVSVITLSEIIALVYQEDEEAAVKAKALVEREVGENNVFSVTREIAELAGKVKARHRFSLADGIILATALAKKCGALVTFDHEFDDVEEIRVIRP